MGKYSQEKIEECAAWVRKNGLIEYGGGTVLALCKACDIHFSTYYDWLERAEFHEAIKKAKEEYREGLEKRIVHSLATAAEGFEWTQIVTQKTGNGVVKQITEKTMREVPNVAACIFLLTNLDPEKWKNKQSSELAGRIDLNQITGMKVI